MSYGTISSKLTLHAIGIPEIQVKTAINVLRNNGCNFNKFGENHNPQKMQ